MHSWRLLHDAGQKALSRSAGVTGMPRLELVQLMSKHSLCLDHHVKLRLHVQHSVKV